jgi:hypothetical protein
LIEIPVYWGNDDRLFFAHYEEIGYLMPVASPSNGLQDFKEELEAQYDAEFLDGNMAPVFEGRLARWKPVEAWIMVEVFPLSQSALALTSAQRDPLYMPSA